MQLKRNYRFARVPMRSNAVGTPAPSISDRSALQWFQRSVGLVSTVRGTRKPRNSSQKLVAKSKIPIGVSNHQRFTVVAKFGAIRKTVVQTAQNADATTPKTANGRGIYSDLNHR